MSGAASFLARLLDTRTAEEKMEGGCGWALGDCRAESLKSGKGVAVGIGGAWVVVESAARRHTRCSGAVVAVAEAAVAVAAANAFRPTMRISPIPQPPPGQPRRPRQRCRHACRQDRKEHHVPWRTPNSLTIMVVSVGLPAVPYCGHRSSGEVVTNFFRSQL